MANFEYTAKSSFKPFTFEEMLRPLAMYTDLYNAIEEGIAELGSKADLMRIYANELSDSRAAAMYNKYANDLDLLAESLAKQGLSPSSRQGLLDLKRRYSSEISPIELAVARRRLLADEQRKAYLLNPTMMYLRDFNTISDETSLDRFIENINYDYGDVYSGELITSDVSKMATNISKELRGYGIGKNIDDYTKTFIKQYGLSSSDILAFANNPNDPLANKVLSAIYDAALSRVPESIKNRYADRVQEAAVMGLWDAVGTNQVSAMEDYAARHPDTTAPSGGGTRRTDTSTPNFETLYFPRHREVANTYLNKDNKLINADKLFINGKFVRPKDKSSESFAGGVPLNLNLGIQNAYDNIVSTLLDTGFSKEAIQNMSQELVELALLFVKNNIDNDVMAKNYVAATLSPEGTKDLVGLMLTRGIIPKEVENLSIDNKAEISGRGTYNYKPLDKKWSEIIKSDESSTGLPSIVYYDRINNVSLFLYDGKFYDIPQSIYYNLDAKMLQTIASDEDIKRSKAEETIIAATDEQLQLKYGEDWEKVKARAILNIKTRYDFLKEFLKNPLKMISTKNINTNN